MSSGGFATRDASGMALRNRALLDRLARDDELASRRPSLYLLRWPKAEPDISQDAADEMRIAADMFEDRKLHEEAEYLRVRLTDYTTHSISICNIPVSVEILYYGYTENLERTPFNDPITTWDNWLKCLAIEGAFVVRISSDKNIGYRTRMSCEEFLAIEDAAEGESRSIRWYSVGKQLWHDQGRLFQDH